MSDDGSHVDDNNNVKKSIGNGGGRSNPFNAVRRRLGRNRAEEAGDATTKESTADIITDTADGVDGNPTKEPPDGTPRSRELVCNAAFLSGVVLTQAGADIGMAAAEAEAEGHGWDVTICICDPAGIPIQVKRNTGIGAVSYELAVNKAKAAALFGTTTGGSKSNHPPWNDPHLQTKGGVPLNLNGICCGAVGVCGLSEPEQDEQVAMAAVKAMADIYWSFQIMASESANS